MHYRRFGRLGWEVSEIGYGMWGMAGWSGSDDPTSHKALDLAVEMGCNFFDTAWAYGDGKSERILAGLLKRNAAKKLYTASKIPPRNRIWPSQKGASIEEVFPKEYIIEYTEKSLSNLGVDAIDFMQFHVWEDAWADNDDWKDAVRLLKEQGKVRSFGISVNRWEPVNCIRSLDTGLIDGIQVIYNIFDQAPEDELFPYCEKNDIAIIARVPFDEGALIGNLTLDSSWPEGDFRHIYFGPENLPPTIERVEQLKAAIGDSGVGLPEMALRFITSNPTVTTVIPGMRQLRNVEANMKAGDGKGLPEEWIEKLRPHRWDRVPTPWSL